MHQIDRYQQQLKESLKRVPLLPKLPPTIMEITGYPHYENVCSNILAFFLDPHQPHGLGTLFLEALADIGGIQEQEWYADSEIEREVVTDTKKRIDILILSNSHAVLIENKIFASTNNPLGEYAKFLADQCQCHKYKYLLTMVPTDEGKNHKFRNITYQELVSKIRDLLGRYVADADTRYLTFMLDFLNTLDYLQGEHAVNEDFLNFLKNNEDAEDFLRACERVKRELKSKVDSLYEKLTDAGIRQAGLRNVSRKKYWRKQLERVLSYTIENGLIENAKVKVRTALGPGGWQTEVSLERNDTARHSKLEEVLRNLGLDPSFERSGECFVYGGPGVDGFGFGADLEKTIFPHLRDLVRRIANR